MLWWPFSRRKRRNAEKKRAKSFGASTPVRAGRPETPRAVSSPGVHTPNNPFAAIAPPQTPKGQQAQARSSIEKDPLEPTETHPARRQSSREDELTALPQSPPNEEFERGPHLRSFDEQRRPISNQQTVAPNVLRRKASRKDKRRDREREEEIRALSSPIAIPDRLGDAPAPMRKGSKRRLSLQPRSNSTGPGNHSAVSLASPSSIRSGVVGKVSESWHHWDVGALDVLSPRPKVRYSMTQYASSPIQSLHASRTGSSRDLRKEWADNKTIDELADDYDVSTIRELMDRDARRLERKKKYQEERARKRLERHAARKREGNTGEEIADPGEESSKAFEGLGLQGEEAGPSSPVDDRHPISRKRDSVQTATSPETTENPFKDPEPAVPEAEIAGRKASGKPEAVAPVVFPPETNVLKDTQMVPPVERAVSPPVSPFSDERKSSFASHQAPVPNRSLQDLTDSRAASPSDRRASDISTKRTGALASLFRRSKRASGDYTKEVPQSDKSFSNTSRESMARQPLPAHLVAPPPSAKRRSGTPQRTMSKFREDLPESPASRTNFATDGGAASSATSETARDSKVSDNGRNDSMSSAVTPSAAGMSQSLASVDSEASWLTSPRHPRRRTSQQLAPATGSVAEGPEDFNASYEDLGQTDEEAFRSRVIPRQRAGSNRIEPLLESELSEHEDSQADLTPDLDENVEYGTAARQPVYVQRHGSARSREGILQQVAGEGKSELSDVIGGSQEDNISTAGLEETPEEVRTVHHVRQVSSGSARLLDIPARKDSKRASLVSSIGSVSGRGTPVAAATAGSLEPAAGAEPGPSETT